MGKKVLLIFILSFLLFSIHGYSGIRANYFIDPGHSKASLTITGLQDLSFTPISSVCPGQTIYIIGSGFGPTSTANMGGTNLTIVGVPTFTQIQAIVPVSASGSLQVITSPFNASYSSFTINTSPNSVLSVSSISPICSGVNGTVIIQNSQTGVTYQAFISGSPVSSTYAGTGSFLSLDIPQNSLTVGNNTIDISATNGCQIVLSTHPSILVHPTPGTANQNLNPTQTNGCSGTTFGIINAGIFAAGDSFRWLSSIVGPTSVFDTVASSNSQNLLPGALTQNTWFKRIIINSFGCKDTSTSVALTVTPYPFGTGFVNSSSLYCSGQDMNFTVNGIYPTSTTYTWQASHATVISSSLNTAVLNFSLAGGDTIQITPQNGACIGSVHKFPVGINQMPNIVTVSSVVNVVCAGANIIIPLASAGTISWDATYSGGANSTPGGGFGSINDNATTPGIINYSVTASIATCNAYRSFSVTVNGPPDTTLLFHKTSDTLCYNQDLTVRLPLSQAGVVYRFYKWNGSITPLDSSGISAGGVITATIPYSKFNPGIDTIRYLAVMPGCTTHINRRNLIVHISYESPLNIIAAPSGTSLCSNGTNGLPLKAPYTPSATLYQWFYNGSEIINETTDSYTAFSEGDYTVLSKDNLSCEALSPSTALNYASPPVVSSSNPSTISTELSCNGAFTTYQWYANTPTGFKKIQGANTNAYTAYFDGSYMVGITNGNCFVLSKEYNLSGKLGGSLLKLLSFSADSSIILPTIDFYKDANVFPNPAVKGEKLSINYIAGSKEINTSFTLYNSQGIEIISKKLQSEGYITIDFEVPEVASGLYKLIINDGVRTICKSITIQ